MVYKNLQTCSIIISADGKVLIHTTVNKSITNDSFFSFKSSQKWNNT